MLFWILYGALAPAAIAVILFGWWLDNRSEPVSVYEPRDSGDTSRTAWPSGYSPDDETSSVNKPKKRRSPPVSSR